MKFEVNILGCSAATPTLKSNTTSQLLNIHDKLFLVDCGEGTQIQLRKFKFKFQRISNIFISHLHGDHYLGLFGLMSSMHLLGRTKTLHIYGPPELHALIDLNIKVSQSYLRYKYEFHPTETKKPELIYEDNTILVHSLPLNHRIPTTGFVFVEKVKKNRIVKAKIHEHELSIEEILKLKNGDDVFREGGETIYSKNCTLPPFPPRKFAFMSDTAPLTKGLELLENTDLLYHESTFLNDKIDRAKDTFHSTAEQAALVAKNSNVKKLCLGHFSNRYTERSLFLDEAKPHFENCILASDGLNIRI
jgi:ribonuclease Z